jgi:hypothetical protein
MGDDGKLIEELMTNLSKKTKNSQLKKTKQLKDNKTITSDFIKKIHEENDKANIEFDKKTKDKPKKK